MWYHLNMRVYIKDVEGLKLPEKAHKTDTGFDVYAASDPVVVGKSFNFPSLGEVWSEIDYIYYKTNIFLNLSEDEKTYINIRPRSSIRKTNLSLCNSVGLCDNGYTGEYIISFNYIFQPSDIYTKELLDPFTFSSNGLTNLCRINYDKLYKFGDKIAQLEFMKGNIDVEFILTTPKNFAALEEMSQRKSNGYGSTDDKVS